MQFTDAPTTVKATVDQIVQNLSPHERAFILEQESPVGIHFTAGMSLRNDLSLWSKNSPIRRDAVDNYGISHADDISGLIFKWVWALIRNEKFDHQAIVEGYEKHWQNVGMTAIEAGGWIDIPPGWPDDFCDVPDGCRIAADWFEEDGQSTAAARLRSRAIKMEAKDDY